MTEDLLWVFFLETLGAERLDSLAPDRSQLRLELSLELGSETTVLSGSWIRDKLPAPVARILFLEKKGKYTKVYICLMGKNDHISIFFAHKHTHLWALFSKSSFPQDRPISSCSGMESTRAQMDSIRPRSCSSVRQLEKRNNKNNLYLLICRVWL